MTLKLLVCAFVLLLSSCGSTDDSGSDGVVIGSRAPSFSLKSLDGATVTSRSLEGNVVILNFWATWCGPCVKEIPELKQVADNSQVKVVSIALDEDGLKTVKPFVERYGINYTVLLGNENVFQRFRGFGIPYTLVLNRSQQIIKIYRGLATKESLEQDVKAISQGS